MSDRNDVVALSGTIISLRDSLRKLDAHLRKVYMLGAEGLDKNLLAKDLVKADGLLLGTETSLEGHLKKVRAVELRKQAKSFYAEEKFLINKGCCADLEYCDIASTWFTAATALEVEADRLEGNK